MLRPCMAGDLARLRRLFEGAAFPGSGCGNRTFRSILSFTKWLLVTFRVIYLMEMKKTVFGFVGLYGMKPGERLILSIAIFNPEDRGKGYGTEALGLLLPHLGKRGLAGEVIAEVSGTNTRSLSFFKEAGFVVTGSKDDRIVLSKKIGS